MTAMSSSTTPSSRPIFDPVDTTFDPTDVTGKDDVASPSLSSSNALARFEFEPGRGREGTKVLMVEWDEDDTTRDLPDEWELSWEGKKTVLPAREQTSAGDDDVPVKRLYFLLGPGVSMPTTVRLQKGAIVWKTNPLPAIFSPELGATARREGKKGILHTIWAKKRLQVLQSEIEKESKRNVEGVGLEMCTAEVEWIEKNFGVLARAASDATNSPRSPGSRPLTDKLRALKIGTGAKELDASGSEPASDRNPLSPETSDVAIGSFGSFAAIKGTPNTSSLAANPAQSTQRRLTPQAAPDSVTAQQRRDADARSLDVHSSTGLRSAALQASTEDPDDLFALPMSPRSDTTAKSPFSFASQDIRAQLQGSPTIA